MTNSLTEFTRAATLSQGTPAKPQSDGATTQLMDQLEDIKAASVSSVTSLTGFLDKNTSSNVKSLKTSKLSNPFTSKDAWWKKKTAYGPAGGVGIGCGVGFGVGITGDIGVGLTGLSPRLNLFFGLGAGCGIGFGYGYGFGIGKRWDQQYKRTGRKRHKY